MSAHRPESEPELVEMLHRSDVRAPAELHSRVGAMVAERSSRRRRPSPPMLAGAAALVAVLAVLLILLLPGSSAPGPDVSETAALTGLAPTAGAPAESAGRPGQLVLAVDGIPFPYWDGTLGWRAAGARTDHIGGRAVTTVFYANSAGRRIGYAIVAGTPAPKLGGGVVLWSGDTSYHLLSEQGSHTVAWLREGHLCVLAGRGVSAATLLRLAGWGSRAGAA